MAQTHDRDITDKGSCSPSNCPTVFLPKAKLSFLQEHKVRNQPASSLFPSPSLFSECRDAPGTKPGRGTHGVNKTSLFPRTHGLVRSLDRGTGWCTAGGLSVRSPQVLPLTGEAGCVSGCWEERGFRPHTQRHSNR